MATQRVLLSYKRLFPTLSVLASIPRKDLGQAIRHALRPRRFATGLLLYDRFRRLNGGDGIGVSMYHLPGAVFRSKNARRPQSQ